MKNQLLTLLLLLPAVTGWAQPSVEVFKSPTCGCCSKWVTHLEEQGFSVSAEDTGDMQTIKAGAGVPPHTASCHTAFVGGYFIEGHVPAADIRRLLEEKPDARGLTVPGMPIGSPGMEIGDRRDRYQVLLVDDDGGTSVFSEYPAK